jgi:hypothetical protein
VRAAIRQARVPGVGAEVACRWVSIKLDLGTARALSALIQEPAPRPGWRSCEADLRRTPRVGSTPLVRHPEHSLGGGSPAKPQPATLSADRYTVRAEFTHPAWSADDWQRRGGTAGGDRINVVWFPGFAPNRSSSRTNARPAAARPRTGQQPRRHDDRRRRAVHQRSGGHPFGHPAELGGFHPSRQRWRFRHPETSPARTEIPVEARLVRARAAAEDRLYPLRHRSPDVPGRQHPPPDGARHPGRGGSRPRPRPAQAARPARATAKRHRVQLNGHRPHQATERLPLQGAESPLRGLRGIQLVRPTR